MCGGAGSLITRLVMCRWPVLAQAGRGGAAADAGAEEARGQGQERHPLRGGRDGDPDPHHGQDIQGDTGHAGPGLVLCSAPSVPQPVVQSRRRPLLGPSPG